MRKLESRHCAFVTFAERPGAEKAAEALAGRLYIQGQRCRLMWGRPQAEKAAPPVAPGGGSATAMLPPQVHEGHLLPCLLRRQTHACPYRVCCKAACMLPVLLL